MLWSKHGSMSSKFKNIYTYLDQVTKSFISDLLFTYCGPWQPRSLHCSKILTELNKVLMVHLWNRSVGGHYLLNCNPLPSETSFSHCTTLLPLSHPPTAPQLHYKIGFENCNSTVTVTCDSLCWPKV